MTIADPLQELSIGWATVKMNKVDAAISGSLPITKRD